MGREGSREAVYKVYIGEGGRESNEPEGHWTFSYTYQFIVRAETSTRGRWHFPTYFPTDFFIPLNYTKQNIVFKWLEQVKI